MNIQKKYEQQLLGRIISDKDSYYQNGDMITADLFIIYPEVFAAYITQINEGQTPSKAKIFKACPTLKDDIISMLSGIDFNFPIEEVISQLAEYRTERLIDAAMLKAGMAEGGEIKVKILTDAITDVYKQERTEFHTGGDIVQKLVDSMTSGKHQGIATGYKYFDEMTGGLQKSDLIILAAETSQGKTSLALNIAESVISQNVPVCVLTMEMTDEQLLMRMVASHTGIGFADKKEFIEAARGCIARYMELPLIVPEIKNNSTTHIAGLIRASVIRYGCKVVVIDYLQLIQDKSKDGREQEIGRTARTLKNIAKELDINIIALSQLSRSHGKNYPTLSRLRDSGQIEEAADIVLFIYRPEMYGEVEYQQQPTEGLAEIIIAKGRNYGTGAFLCKFEKHVTRFVDDFAGRGNGAPTHVAADDDTLPF